MNMPDRPWKSSANSGRSILRHRCWLRYGVPARRSRRSNACQTSSSIRRRSGIGLIQNRRSTCQYEKRPQLSPRGHMCSSRRSHWARLNSGYNSMPLAWAAASMSTPISFVRIYLLFCLFHSTRQSLTGVSVPSWLTGSRHREAGPKGSGPSNCTTRSRHESSASTKTIFGS